MVLESEGDAAFNYMNVEESPDCWKQGVSRKRELRRHVGDSEATETSPSSP